MVVRSFETDPQATAEAIATRQHLKSSAVKKRIARLKKRGVLLDRMVVPARHSRFSERVVVFLDIDRAHLQRKSRPGYNDYHGFVEFLRRNLLASREWLDLRKSSRLDGDIRIEGIFTLEGGGHQIDVVLVIAATDRPLISRLVVDVIDRLEGVRRSNTGRVFDGFWFQSGDAPDS